MSKLTSGLVSEPADPTLAAMDTSREPQTAPPEAGDGLVDVFLTVAIRTSGGNGPGVVRVPQAEATAIVNDRHGVRGTAPPRGYEDGGMSGQGVAAMMPRTVSGGR